MKDYTVFNINLAHELIKKGFKLTGKQLNRNNPKFFVYYFQEEEGLIEAVKDFVNKNKHS